MATKVTLLMHTRTVQNQTTRRVGGYSESVYTDLTFPGAAIDQIVQKLGVARANLMGTGSTIIGYRYQKCDIVDQRIVHGASIAEDWLQPGTYATAADHPNMALRFPLRTPDMLTERQYRLCSVPDAVIVTGEFSNVANYLQLVNAYRTELVSNWKMLTIKKSNGLKKIVGVAAPAGGGGGPYVYTTGPAHGFAPGDQVKFNRTYYANGRDTVKKLYRVLLTPTDRTFTLVDGPFDGVIHPHFDYLGAVRKYELEFATMEATGGSTGSYLKTCTRKVGAPFEGFVGRS